MHGLLLEFREHHAVDDALDGCHCMRLDLPRRSLFHQTWSHWMHGLLTGWLSPLRVDKLHDCSNLMQGMRCPLQTCQLAPPRHPSSLLQQTMWIPWSRQLSKEFYWKGVDHQLLAKSTDWPSEQFLFMEVEVSVSDTDTLPYTARTVMKIPWTVESWPELNGTLCPQVSGTTVLTSSAFATLSSNIAFHLWCPGICHSQTQVRIFSSSCSTVRSTHFSFYGPIVA